MSASIRCGIAALFALALGLVAGCDRKASETPAGGTQPAKLDEALKEAQNIIASS